MRRRLFCRPLLLCAILTLCRPAILCAADAPPEPEQYIEDGHYLQYAQAAQSFLLHNPDSLSAPRVAMDLLAAATVFDDQPSAARMRTLILCGHPTSVQAKYLVDTLPDAGAFVNLLGQAASENFEAPPAGFALRYDQALHLGIARFGAPALGGGGGLVCTYLLAGAAGDVQIQKAAVEVLNASGPSAAPWARILVIVADNTATPLARLAALHALPDRANTAPFEGYLINQLLPADRDSSQVVQIEAEDTLYAGRMTEALPLLAKLGPAADEPRWLFWRGWANAAAGNTSAALDAFTQLTSRHPDDPWAKQAADLTAAVSAVDPTLAHNVEAALSLSRRLSTGVDLLEARGSFPVTGGQTVDVYLGFDAPKLLELVFSRQDKPAIAYRATDQDASLYIQGATAIARFAKPAPLPAPQVAFLRVGEDFLIRSDVKFLTSFDAFRSALTNLLASDNVSTREGLQDVLHSFVRKGHLPLPPAAQADGSTVYQWVTPAVASPALSRLTITVGPDGALTSVQTADYAITDVRYGTAGAFKLTPPALPDLPTVDRGPMDTTILQQMVPLVGRLFIPPPPATQPATQPAAAH